MPLMLVFSFCVAQNDFRRAKGLTDNDWERMTSRPEYSRELIAVQDSLLAGQTISVSHLQALMPLTYNDFRIFLNMEYYAVTTDEFGHLQAEDDKGIWQIAANYAKADSLDMMKYLLMWFEWSDGWVADWLWDEAVKIERYNPQKFKELMASSKKYENWQIYREEYIKWEQSKKGKE